MAKRRWYFVLVLLRAACSSSARSSCLRGATRSSRRARSPLARSSSQAANRRPAIARPRSPNSFWAASPLAVGGEVAHEVGPAELAPLGVEVVVGPPAIGAGDAPEVLAEERLGLALVPVGRDPEERRPLGQRAPKRAPLSRRAPAGFVHVHGGSGADLLVQSGVGRCERFAGALDDGVDRAGRELHPEQLVHEFHGVAAGDAVADGDRRDGRLQAGAEGRAGDAGGKLGPRAGGAGGAAQAVEAVLAHRDRDRRQLGNLVALHGGRVHPLVLPEDMRAGLAALRPVLDDLIDALERKQRPVPAFVPGLAASPSARAWLA